MHVLDQLEIEQTVHCSDVGKMRNFYGTSSAETCGNLHAEYWLVSVKMYALLTGKKTVYYYSDWKNVI
jgi:hypothetical protein